MDNRKPIQQDDLLKSVLEVSDILKQQRPDLKMTISQLAEVQAVLLKSTLSTADLEWIDKTIRYLCHFKCLYDFCPLERLDWETEQECWQRWGNLLDRMRNHSNLLRSNIEDKNGRKVI